MFNSYKHRLRYEANAIQAELLTQQEEVEKAAERLGCTPAELRNADGGWPMLQILVAKANVLNALALSQDD